MKIIASFLASLLVVPAIFACDGNSNESSDNGNTPAARQTLVVSGDCTFAACGVVPSSLGAEAKVSCESTAEASCTWSGSGDDSTVSYRFCAEVDCPSKPDIDCPDGTRFASQVCGAENDGPCAWSTTCAPPRVTTPCPDPKGCDALPIMTIGIICSDGSSGGFTCVTDSEKCYWERDCD